MENNKIIKVAIVKGIMAIYSKGFYDRLLLHKDLLVKVYCQERIPGMNLKTIHQNYPDNVKLVKFYSAKRDRLSWQFLPWNEILTNYDVIFVTGNPRNLSHVLLASWLKLNRKKVVLWTMAHSFRSNPLTENIRLLWSRIFDFLLVYTDEEVAYLQHKGFKNNFIIGQNNGLDQKYIDVTILSWTESRLQDWRFANDLNNHILILSCARLEQKNKFYQIIEALPAIINQVPNILWCVIGEGAERNNLEVMVNATGLEKHVRFVGPIYQETELAPWFLSSEILVHPAGIGLTLQHSFGYGLPVVTHGEKKLHGPDYAAFEPELTGRNFRIGDIMDLSATIIQLLYDNEARMEMKRYVQKVARNNYNVDIMVERFVHITKKAFNN